MLQIDLLSPSRPVVSAQASEVGLPGKEGYLGILPGHAALITELGVGELRIVGDAFSRKFFISGGYAEVLNDRVQVMADVVDAAGEIDLERAKKARDRALERLKNSGPTSLDVFRAEASLKRALYRLKISQS